MSTVALTTSMPVTVRAAQVLAGAMGLLMAAGVFIFAIAPADEALDVILAVPLVAAALGILSVAVLAGTRRRRVRTAGLALAAAHVVWTIYKVFPYGEQESVMFFALNVPMLACLATASARDWFSR
ncbi:MAG: hypothetical protein ACRDPC_26225 [Solirubrobacteraceae bacterium]